MSAALINSFKPVYTNVTGRFFRQFQGSPAMAEVRGFQQRLVVALEAADPAAAESMRVMLARGEELMQGGVIS